MNAVAHAALTAPEWRAYTTWSEANLRKRYGRASRDGFLSGFREGVVYAGPSWVTITPQQREEHRQECRHTCLFCSDHRAFGACRSCGGHAEAVGPDELSSCCGSRVNIGAGE